MVSTGLLPIAPVHTSQERRLLAWNARILNMCDNPHAKDFKNTLCPIESNPLIFIAFIPRNLGFGNVQAFRKILLTQPFGDTNADQQASEAV